MNGGSARISLLWLVAACLAGCGDDPTRPTIRDEFRFESFYTPIYEYDDLQRSTLDSPIMEEGWNFRVAVSRTDSTGQAVFLLSLIDDTARAGEDFSARTDTVVMEPGEVTRDWIHFNTLEDVTREPIESMRLVLTSLSSDYGVATPDLVIQIVDNDEPKKEARSTSRSRWADGGSTTVTASPTPTAEPSCNIRKYEGSRSSMRWIWTEPRMR